MEHPRTGQGGRRRVIKRDMLVGRVVADEAEVPLPLVVDRNEGQRRGGTRIDLHGLGLNGILAEGLREKPAEGIVADPSKETGSPTEARKGNGDIGGRAAGRLKERFHLLERARRLLRDEVDQQLAEAKYIDGFFMHGAG